MATTTASSDKNLAGKGGTPVPPAGGDGAPGPGHNVTKNNAEVREAVHSAIEEIIALEADRKAINDNISATREKVKARGINMHAFKAALAYRKMDTTQRDGFDDSLVIARSAVGLPIQTALFEEADPPAPSEDGNAGDPAENGKADTSKSASGRGKKH